MYQHVATIWLIHPSPFAWIQWPPAGISIEVVLASGCDDLFSHVWRTHWCSMWVPNHETSWDNELTISAWPRNDRSGQGAAERKTNALQKEGASRAESLPRNTCCVETERQSAGYLRKPIRKHAYCTIDTVDLADTGSWSRRHDHDCKLTRLAKDLRRKAFEQRKHERLEKYWFCLDIAECDSSHFRDFALAAADQWFVCITSMTQLIHSTSFQQYWDLIQE